MSRRESRVSMNVRQNDALFEFENCMSSFCLSPFYSLICGGIQLRKSFCLPINT
jgi:hypothetical protein